MNVALAWISILVKYGPGLAALIKQEEPVIQQFIKDVEAAFAGSGAAPDIGAVLLGFLTQLHNGTPPAAAAGAVLEGPGFVFPTQQVAQPTGAFKS